MNISGVSAQVIDSGSAGNWMTKSGWKATSDNENKVSLHVEKYKIMRFRTDMSIFSTPKANGCTITISNLNPHTPDGGYFGDWQGNSLTQKWTVDFDVTSKNAVQWYKERNFGREIVEIVI